MPFSESSRAHDHHERPAGERRGAGCSARSAAAATAPRTMGRAVSRRLGLLALIAMAILGLAFASTALATTRALSVSVGAYDTSCAVMDDHSVQCWGRNQYGGTTRMGLLGNGDPLIDKSLVPVTVSGITTATAVAVGQGAVCALLADKTVSCWGSDFFGELGDGIAVLPDVGHTHDSAVPVAVTGLTGVKAIAVGQSSECALTEGGSVYCWGSGEGGQLGQYQESNGQTYPNLNSSSSPLLVAGVTGATSISVGQGVACAGLQDGTVVCWGGYTAQNVGGITMSAGLNMFGQVGSACTPSVTLLATVCAPTPIADMSGTASISGTYLSGCGLQTSHSILCWGANTFGMLGNGSRTNYADPDPVTGITTATSASMGAYHGCAVLADASLACWGANVYGELGDGSTTDSDVPVVVPRASNVQSVSANGTTTCTVSANGALSCWGHNAYGQIGDGTTTDSSVPRTVTGSVAPGAADPAAPTTPKPAATAATTDQAATSVSAHAAHPKAVLTFGHGKSALAVRAGVRSRIVLHVRNAGTTAMTGAVIRVTLPAGVTAIRASARSAAHGLRSAMRSEGGTVVIEVGRLAPGKTASYALLVTAPEALIGTSFALQGRLTAPGLKPQTAKRTISVLTPVVYAPGVTG